MTKAKTTSRSAGKADQLKINASTAEAKRQRGKAPPVDEGRTTATAPVAATERPTDIPTTDATPAATPKAPRQTKAAHLRARLAESGGVSLAALIEATGWQAHTLRACLSGLRKEGLTLTRRRDGEDTIYAIDTGGSAAGNAGGERLENEAVPDAPRAVLPENGDDVATAPASTPHPVESNA